jgi:cytidylate kinase
MPVITVSGSLGSGAREVAQATAAEMRLEYVDQEIMLEAARQLGVRVADVESRDERKSSFGERLASVMRTLMERSAAAGAADPLSGGGLEMVLARSYGEAADLSEATTGQLDDERYIKTLTSVLKGVAKRGDVVILGRGSQAILRDEPGVLHVYVASSLEHRINTMMTRDDISQQDAEKRIRESDKNRIAFHRHYFKVEPDSPALYDLGINAGRIRTDVAAKMIAIAARDKTPRPG